MKQYDLIADRIEEVIGNMFAAVKTDFSGQFSYSLLFNPRKNRTWFVVLFSPTPASFRMALQEGTCYHLYSYLSESVFKDDILKDVDIFKCFETGDRPANTEEYASLFSIVSDKLDRLRNASKSTDGNCRLWA